MKPTNNSNNFLLLLLLSLLIPFTFGQLLLPSTHSPAALSSAMASSSSRRPCPCPTGKQPPVPIPKMKVAKVQAKAPDRGGEEKLAPLVMDESLLGALRDVGQRLAPFKTGGGGKGKKKKKGTGRTTKRLNRRHNRPKRQQQQPNQIVDPALAGPEGTKCNSERIRQIIRKAKGRDSAALKRNIQALAERTFSARFNVVCARGDFSYISNTEEFCQDRVHGNTCYVFRQLGRELPFPEPPQLDQFERSLVGKRAPTSQQKWRRKKA